MCFNTIVGIATYTVQPFEAGSYLNKIQCFCFEEQRLNPHEQVDLPVFFYIDPDYVNDPLLENVHNIVLSYTFYEAPKYILLLIIKSGKHKSFLRYNQVQISIIFKLIPNGFLDICYLKIIFFFGNV